MDILKKLAEEFPSVRADRAQNIVNLIDDGNTIPFIARYRKEMTGGIDDQLLREFNDRLIYLRNLEKRKEEVASAIEEQGKMTEEIRAALDAAVTLTEVEDVYRPYKQKKKTRAGRCHRTRIATARGVPARAGQVRRRVRRGGEVCRRGKGRRDRGGRACGREGHHRRDRLRRRERAQEDPQPLHEERRTRHPPHRRRKGGRAHL